MWTDPFLSQRLCELLTQPKRHYKRVDKFMRGLEKVRGSCSALGKQNSW